jgi:hypothetical protein
MVPAVVGRENAEQKFTAHSGVALISETSDCRPILHGLIIAFFRSCIRTSILICVSFAPFCGN